MLESKLGLALDCQNSTFLLAQSNISKMLFLMSWGFKVAKAFCQGEGFRDAHFGIVVASQQLLVSYHVRERDKGSLRSTLSGGVWNDVYSDRSEVKSSLGGFVVGLMVMDIYFGIAPILH